MAAHVAGHAKGGRSFAGATSTHSPQSSEASMPAGRSKAEVPTYEIRPSQQGQGMSSFGMFVGVGLRVALSWQYLGEHLRIAGRCGARLTSS